MIPRAALLVLAVAAGCGGGGSARFADFLTYGNRRVVIRLRRDVPRGILVFLDDRGREWPYLIEDAAWGPETVTFTARRADDLRDAFRYEGVYTPRNLPGRLSDADSSPDEDVADVGGLGIEPLVAPLNTGFVPPTFLTFPPSGRYEGFARDAYAEVAVDRSFPFVVENPASGARGTLDGVAYAGRADEFGLLATAGSRRFLVRRSELGGPFFFAWDATGGGAERGTVFLRSR